jgi:molybdopterin-guanine dinucleotide biosynthesis protein A
MDSVEGFILIGGASSRMGTDKSRLMLNGRTFTELIAETVLQVTDSVKLVGKEGDDLGLESAPDVFKGWGALGGLHAAMAACKAEWCLVVACDLPFVTSSLLERMAGLRGSFDAVAPIQENGYLQPLCAMYRVDPCLKQCEALILAGARRPQSLVELVKTRLVRFEELKDLNGADRFFDNINTPEDYTIATAKGGDPTAKG